MNRPKTRFFSTLAYYIFENIFLLLSLVLISLTLLYRRHLDTSHLALLKLAIVSTFLFVGPHLLVRRAAHMPKLSWIRLPEAFVFVLLIFIGIGIFYIPGSLLILVTLIGWGLWKLPPPPSGEIVLRSHVETFCLLVGLTAVMAVFSFYIFESGWDSRYLSLTFYEELLCGHANRDTIAHIAYSSMFQQYHQFAAGIHGLTPFRYHLGSHIFYVAISNITHLPLWMAYNFGHVIIVIPYLFHVIHGLYLRPLVAVNLAVNLAALLFFIGLLLVPYPEVRMEGIWGPSYVSESFTFSKILALYS